jgi:hypothetical protein
MKGARTMKLVTYTIFTVACVVLLHGAIQGAEVSAPTSITPANVAQSSDEETRMLVVAQAEGAQGEKPAGEIEERAVPRMAPGGVPTFPPTTRPTIPSTTRPSIPPPPGGTSPGPQGGLGGVMAPLPTTVAPQPVYVGPTDNLTKVANAIHVSARSLTTAVTVAPGLTLTQPVTISIALGGYGPTRITQPYVASTGNYFWYNDPAGDGKPRRAMVDIALTEPKPGGGFYSYTIPGGVTLDPLYDVAITPLTFTLFSGCSVTTAVGIGDDDIQLSWWSPDKAQHGVEFKTQAGDHKTINEFAWTRAEVSASANLIPPGMGYKAGGIWPCFPGSCFYPGAAPGPPPPNLVPGVTRQVVTTLEEAAQLCSASAQYNSTYTLRSYPNLGK